MIKNTTDWIKNRRLLIATQHEKERCIGPIMKKNFEISYHTPKIFNTDCLGTFTGEIERIYDPVTTVKQKCLQAMEMEGFDLGIASEGSFGPHPSILFTPVNEEWMVLIDKRNNYEIIVKVISTDTNFGGVLIHNLQELKLFARSARFPTHGLIIRKNKSSKSDIIKGLRSEQDLLEAFQRISRESSSIYVETDMRAHQNPTRMNTISNLTKKLVLKIKSRCPSCMAPGFGNQRVVPGLPCSFCGTATKSAYLLLITCPICQHETETKFPNGKQKEDPMYCEHCNP